MRDARTRRPAQASPWTPIGNSLFRSLWIGLFFAEVALWVNGVAVVWLVASLSSSPAVLALVQTASALPVFVLAVPAGALADVVDRRILLMAAQAYMTVFATVLAIVSAFGGIDAWLVLSLTAALGAGLAFTAPAAQAALTQVVDGPTLPAAVALGWISINVARAIGPAVGGGLVALVGATPTLAIAALALAGVTFQIYRWPLPRQRRAFPAERFVGAMRVGARFLFQSKEMHAVLLRAASFFIFASSFLSLLPVLAKHELSSGPAAYGLYLGIFGVGAVGIATLLPGLRALFPLDQIELGTRLIFAIASILGGFSRGPWTLGVAAFMAGGAWLMAMSCLNVGAQNVVPAWVRARAMGAFLVTLFGSIFLGSFLFAALSFLFGARIAMELAAATLLLSVVPAHRFGLSDGENLDLNPSLHWPLPQPAATISADAGPVMVAIDYEIDPRQRKKFAATMNDLRRIRLRNGAVHCWLFEEIDVPTHQIEIILVESWAEYLRQWERMTGTDRDVQLLTFAFHRGESPPKVSKFVAGMAGLATLKQVDTDSGPQLQRGTA